METETIGSVKLNYDHYTGTDEYSDGDIENDLLQLLKAEAEDHRTLDYERLLELLRGEDRWPILYHLSPVRENILEWYDMKPDAKVLEIGAGCGAVTGALCKKAAHVTSVELSQKRALCNAYRNYRCENLDILVGNFHDMEFTETYDYITLIGVLEYANYFTGKEDSFARFLTDIAALLKPDGRLLIAIENQYGLKYFAGQAEDHTGRLFDGVENYASCESKARTFSKNGLRKLAQKAGLGELRFYYPFPDYKFPVQIFSDERLPKKEDLVCSRDSFDNDRMDFFDETEAYGGIVAAGLFDVFANSYFIEAGKVAFSEERQKIYSKMTRERKQQYQIETAIYRDKKSGEYSIQKRALTGDAAQHIHAMQEYYERTCVRLKEQGAQVSLCKARESEGTICFSYLQGESMCDKLLAALLAGDKARFETLLGEYQKLVSELADLKDESGADHMNIDLTFDNIIETSPGGYTVIDYEWCVTKETELSFVVFRALFAFEMRYSTLVSRYYAPGELFALAGIGEEEAKRFRKQNEEFIDYVYGKDGYQTILEAYQKDLLPFSRVRIHPDIFAQLFIDEGNGFREDSCQKAKLKREGLRQELVFDLTGKRIAALRYDPINKPAFMDIYELYGLDADGNRIPIPIREHNAKLRRGDAYLFSCEDPVLFLEVDPEHSPVTLVIRQKLLFADFGEEAEPTERLNTVYTELLSEKRGAEDQLLHALWETLDDHRTMYPDGEKLFAVTRKMQKMRLDGELLPNELLLTGETFSVEFGECVNQLMNHVRIGQQLEEELRRVNEAYRRLESELTERNAQNQQLQDDLNWIRGSRSYRLFLKKKDEKRK